MNTASSVTHGNELAGKDALVIPYVPALDNLHRLSSDVFKSLCSDGRQLEVGEINWPDFPYRPEVRAWLGHSRTHLFCAFAVKESHVSVRTLHDNGPVWEDSCVELFIGAPDGEHYYNFEANAAGAVLASWRVSRTECIHFNDEQMSGILRWTSLEHKLHDVHATDGEGIAWNLVIAIPFESIGYSVGIPEELRVNLYKCGDKTECPHFLSWAPIHTEAPDFHRPESFRAVQLG